MRVLVSCHSDIKLEREGERKMSVQLAGDNCKLINNGRKSEKCTVSNVYMNLTGSLIKQLVKFMLHMQFIFDYRIDQQLQLLVNSQNMNCLCSSTAK